MSDSTRLRRRWFQFSLRTLLVFMLVCGAGLGWLGNKVDAVARAKMFIASIRPDGASGNAADEPLAYSDKRKGCTSMVIMLTDRERAAIQRSANLRVLCGEKQVISTSGVELITAEDAEGRRGEDRCASPARSRGCGRSSISVTRLQRSGYVERFGWGDPNE